MTCFEDLCDKSKKFKLYQTQMRKANRIQVWAEKMEKKKKKALTTFKNASMAMKKTMEMKSNNTKLDLNEMKVLNDELAKCNNTAPALCDTSNVAGLDTARSGECIPKLKSYLDDYSVGQLKFLEMHD